MYLGPKKPHIPSVDDLTIIYCSCGWHSKEFAEQTLVSTLGVPWYCDDCGRQTGYYVTFHPSERPADYQIVTGE